MGAPHDAEAAAAEALERAIATEHELRRVGGLLAGGDAPPYGRSRGFPGLARELDERVWRLHRLCAFATHSPCPCKRGEGKGPLTEKLQSRTGNGRQSYWCPS